MFERYYKAKREAKRVKKTLYSTLDSHKVIDGYTHQIIFTGSYNECCKFQRAFGVCSVAIN